MDLCKTRLGDVPVAGPIEMYANGSVHICSPSGACVLETPVGNLVPQYSTDDLRRKTVQALSFYESGLPKSVPLEDKTLVKTPIGDVVAELVTFHPGGGISRVFPLNGKLSGYWSQEDEAGLADPIELMTPIGLIRTKIIGISFYENEALRSVTLWPGEIVEISTPVGTVKSRVGFSFSPEGRLESVEPGVPSAIKTYAGEILAYDSDAVGIHADHNSLVFGKDGSVTHIATTLTSIIATDKDGKKSVFTPLHRESICGEGETEVIPMHVDFTDEYVKITQNPDLPSVSIPVAGHRFVTRPCLPGLASPLGIIPCSV